MIFSYYRVSLLIILLALLLLLPTSCKRSLRSFYHEGVSKELAVYRARHIYDVHYDLTFHIPATQQEKIKGSVRIHFKPLKAQHGVILDFQPGEDAVHSVKLNGDTVSYKVMSGHIYLDANGMIPRQNNIVEVDFTASDQAMNRSEDFMYTLFVPDRASTAFPCFDQPDIKASFDLQLEIPLHWTALSNGPLLDEKEGEQTRQMLFSCQKPISTYLFAFTAGAFSVETQTRDERSIHIYHRETDKESLDRNLPTIFEQHFHSLQWMEDYTGIAFPYEKFDLAILPGFQYSGMEHPGAIWYRDTRLLLDENAPLTRRLSKASLIAHETAHMWFGNLVTMQWFDDVWLKEVFAGFMADKIVAGQFPDVNHQLQFVMAHYPRAYSIDRSPGTHPIKQQLSNMKMAGTLYGPVIYNKAPIIFEQLEKIMGEMSFRTAVREYLTTYAHDNADWIDLVTIFDKNSERNISQWSDAWVYGKGMPVISYVMQNQQENKNPSIAVFTEQPEGVNDFPAQYLSAAMIFSDTIIFQEIWLDNELVIAELDSRYGMPKSVVLNGGGMGYGIFAMQPVDIEFGLHHLENIKDINLRAALLVNMHQNFLHHAIDALTYARFLFMAIALENNQHLQSYLLNNLQVVLINFLDYEFNSKLYYAAEKLLWSKLENEENSSREMFFEAWMKLARNKDSAFMMQRLYEGKDIPRGFSISEQNRTQLALEGAMRSDENAHLPEMELARLDNPDRQRRLRFMLPAISPDKQQRDAFFEQLLQAENRNPEPWVLEALYFLHHPLHPQQGMDYIDRSLQLLEEIQRTGDIFFPQNWLGATLQNYNDAEVAQKIVFFLDDNPDLPENLRLKVLQAADIISRSAKLY